MRYIIFFLNKLWRDVKRMAGQKRQRALVKSDPFGGNKCFYKKCLSSQNHKNTISCGKNNVGYKISCNHCKAAYQGETGENMYTRFKSHKSKHNSRVKTTRDSLAYVNTFVTSMEGYKKEKHLKITLKYLYLNQTGQAPLITDPPLIRFTNDT